MATADIYQAIQQVGNQGFINPIASDVDDASGLIVMARDAYEALKPLPVGSLVSESQLDGCIDALNQVDQAMRVGGLDLHTELIEEGFSEQDLRNVLTDPEQFATTSLLTYAEGEITVSMNRRLGTIQAYRSVGESVGDAIRSYVPVSEEIFGPILDGARKIFNAIRSAVDDILDAISKGIEFLAGVIDSLCTAVGSIIQEIKNVILASVRALIEAAKALLDYIPAISIPNLLEDKCVQAVLGVATHPLVLEKITKAVD